MGKHLTINEPLRVEGYVEEIQKAVYMNRRFPSGRSKRVRIANEVVTLVLETMQRVNLVNPSEKYEVGQFVMYDHKDGSVTKIQK